MANQKGSTIEQINDEIIIKGLELGFIHLLVKEYSDLTPILKSSFDYHSETELYTIRKGSKFTANIPIELRVKYYLTSHLRHIEKEQTDKKISSKFDDIVLAILPMLKNGDTPENQTILKVLEDIAERTGEDGWRLKQNGQRRLFE